MEFFARVIWQESRFRADAVGPVTRSGKRAHGIAQFMPGTAAERNLLDPFDPIQALPKSAEFLRDLRREFGNLGLAAAAYNAGPRRVREWLAGTRRDAGRDAQLRLSRSPALSVEEWARRRQARARAAGAAELRAAMAMLKRAPNPVRREAHRARQPVAVAPWGVQLSADFSRDSALASYAALARRYARDPGRPRPQPAQHHLRRPTAPTFYQVRVGADTRAAAEGLCGSIRRAGGACLVLRNTPG